MQKLGTGLLISRMVIDGHRVFCERMDGHWQSGTGREQAPLALDTIPECSDAVRTLLEEAVQANAARPLPAPAPVASERDELAELASQLTPDVKAELLALLRLRVGSEPARSVEAEPIEPSMGYVYTDPETGAKRWISGDLPPESSAAYPCSHCQKVWSSERALFTHARQCADNPDSLNYKGAHDLMPEEGAV